MVTYLLAGEYPNAAPEELVFQATGSMRNCMNLCWQKLVVITWKKRQKIVFEPADVVICTEYVLKIAKKMRCCGRYLCRNGNRMDIYNGRGISVVPSPSKQPLETMGDLGELTFFAWETGRCSSHV